jgi:hypothetical protein
MNIIESMESTGTIYLLRYSKGYSSVHDELLNEKALINNADCSAYCTGYDSICTLEDAIEYYESIGYEIYKLTNIQVKHLTK